MTSLNALVAPGGVERGLTALFTEIDRVARFGFTATELDRQGRSLQRLLENAAVEKNKSPSGPLADEFIRNFLQGEPIPGHRVRVRVEPAFPARDHARRNQRAREGLGARSQPRRGDHRAGKGQSDAAGRGENDGRHRRRQRQTAGRVRRYGQHAAAARAAPVAGAHRHHLDQRAAWHHRVASVQRRPRRAETDDVQGRRDSVSRHQPRRHVARARPGLHCGGNGRRSGCAGRAWQAPQPRSQQGSRRPQRVGEGRHRRDGRRTRRRGVAQRPRDDVPAHLSHVHGAARRSRGVRRLQGTVEGGAGEPGRAARHGVRRGARARR